MSTSNQKITVLAVHPVGSAATRLRAAQYAPHLEAAGFEVVVWTFFDDRSLARWFGPRHRDRVIAVLQSLARVASLVPAVRGAAVLWVQREALPFGPPVIELVAGWGRKVVWDIDDALWESYASPTAGRVPRWLRATGDKFRWLCAHADEVWAGSEVLAEWCRRHNDDVHVIPTVVEVPAEHPDHHPGRTVSWIGSHSTGLFVEAVLPAVAEIRPQPHVLVVGARVTAPPGLEVEQLPWTPEIEDETLRATRVGLYPIDPEHALAEGKCGLKAILYMAHGVPCVVTPTTTNARVVRDGIDGLYARTPAEWTDAVTRLLDDGELRERLSRSAHARAREHYSLRGWAPTVIERLARLAGPT